MKRFHIISVAGALAGMVLLFVLATTLSKFVNPKEASVTQQSSVASSISPSLLPANRIIDWTPGVTVGVPGGIKNRTTICATVNNAPVNPQSTTGTMAAGSDQLTVTSVADFEVGHGIRVVGASNHWSTSEITSTIKAINGNVLTLGNTALVSVTNTSVKHDDSAAIQAGINSCPENQVVYLPAGVYKLTMPITISTYSQNPAVNKITVRGDGDATILDGSLLQWGNFFSVGSGTDYQWLYPNVSVVGSPLKGATTLNVGDTSFLNNYDNGGIGALTRISLVNSDTLPVVNVSGYGNSRTQMTRIVSKTSNTITISPALYFDLPESAKPKINIAGKQSDFIGLENFKIDMTNTKAPIAISFGQTYASWVTGVTAVKTPNYFIGVGDSLGCEISHNNLRERQAAGTNGAAILFGNTSGCLVEDNILYKVFPQLEINASAGNVFAYNFIEANNVYGIMGAAIDSNHGPHSSFNLYEGNIASVFQSDGYFGSNSDDTLFRNWFHATDNETDQFGRTIGLNRFARNINILGNILGRPGYTYQYDNQNGGTSYSTRYIYNFGLPWMGNGGHIGHAKLSEGRPWADFNLVGTLTSKGSDNNTAVVTLNTAPTSLSTNQWPIAVTWTDGGRWSMNVGSVSGNQVNLNSSGAVPSNGNPLPPIGTVVKMWPGANGFSELDEDVQATTLRWGNYDFASRSIKHDPQEIPKGIAVPTTQTLPPSLYRTSKPEWWPGDIAWPAFNPSNPVTEYTAIPAGYRYVNNIGITPTTPTVPTPEPIVDTQAPTVPTSVIANSISVAQINLTWTASTDNVGVTGYRVYRNGILVSTTVNNAFADKNLTAGTNYSYTISAYDAVGNSSNQSTSVSATTLEVVPPPPATDTTAPTISGFNSPNVKATTAEIRWTTNEPTTTQLIYGTSSSFGNKSPLINIFTTSHSVTLTGLTPRTKYYIQAASIDAAGNVTISSNKTFTTKAK